MVTPHVDEAGDEDEEEEDSEADKITSNTTIAHESRRLTKRLSRG
jgi:hypothetical protein